MSEIEKGAIERRTVIKGAAWSIPVIAAAVAAPAAAATTTNDGELQLEEFDIRPSTIKSNETFEVELRVDYDRYSGGGNGAPAAAGTVIVFPTPAALFGTTATVTKADGDGATISGVSVTVANGVTTVTLGFPIQRISNYHIKIAYTAPVILSEQHDVVTTVTSFTNPNTPPVIQDSNSKNTWKNR